MSVCGFLTIRLLGIVGATEQGIFAKVLAFLNAVELIAMAIRTTIIAMIMIPIIRTAAKKALIWAILITI